MVTLRNPLTGSLTTVADERLSEYLEAGFKPLNKVSEVAKPKKETVAKAEPVKSTKTPKAPAKTTRKTKK